MASRSLGVLSIDLVAKTGGFEQGMDKAARTADRRMKEIERRAKQMGTVLGTALAAGAGIAAAALIASTKAAIDNADAIRDMSIRLGTATETLSAYGYAAGQTGTDLDTLGRGLKVLAKNAADSLNPTSEQAKVFEALGVSAQDAEGNLKGLATLVPEIADKFAQLEDGTTKAALAQALFGKAGLDLTEFLNSGSQGLAEMTRRAEELGIVVDAQTAAAADEFNDILGEMKAIMAGVGLEIARGLLPSLNEGASSLRDMAERGELASNAVTVLSAAFQLGVGAIEAYNTAVRVTSAAMTTFVEAGQGYAEAVINVWAPWSDGTIAGGIDKARAALGNFNAIAAKTAVSPFANVRSSATNGSQTDSGLEGRLGRALANPTAPRASKGGKSDAEREAESLQKAYDSLMESMQERIALFNTEGEAAKVAYDLEFGSLSALSAAQKESVLTLAQQYDQMVKVREEGEARAEMAREETDRINEGLEAGKQVLDDLRFELELMKMTNDERITAIQLRGLEAEAVAEYGQQIADANRQITESMEQVEMMDAFRDSFGNFFEDVLSGTKSVKDAFKDMLDDINRQILKRIVDNWVGQLFGEQGSSGTGSAGGGWMDVFASFFGGGKAGGGWAGANTLYEVNERGMEMASVNGRDYLLTGGKPVEITPNHALPGMGGTTVVNMTLQGRVDRRTEAQIAREIAVRQNIAMARNG